MMISDGPSPGSSIGSPNSPVVKEALKVFFLEQNDDGLWDKGRFGLRQHFFHQTTMLFRKICLQYLPCAQSISLNFSVFRPTNI